MRRWAIAFAVLAAASPAAAAPSQVGTWQGMGQPYDKSQMWLVQMAPDGGFRGHFRTCIKGQALDQIQTGRWTIKGDIETITLETLNGEPHHVTDVYQILSNDGKKQTYRFLTTGFVYTSYRVAKDYELPSCEAIS